MSTITAVNFGNIEKRYSRITPFWNGGASGISATADKITESFKNATPIIDSNGIRIDYQTDVISGSSAGYFGDTQYPRSLDIEMYIRFKIRDTTNTRVFIGFTDKSAVTMVNQDFPVGNFCGMQYYTTRGDTHFKATSSLGNSKTSQDSQVIADTNIHELYLRIWSDFGNSECQMQFDDTDLIDITNNLPPNNTNLGLVAFVSTLTSQTRHLELGHCVVTTRI